MPSRDRFYDVNGNQFDVGSKVYVVKNGFVADIGTIVGVDGSTPLFQSDRTDREARTVKTRNIVVIKGSDFLLPVGEKIARFSSTEENIQAVMLNYNQMRGLSKQASNYAAIFDAIRPGQAVYVAMRSVMGMGSKETSGEFQEFKAGKKSISEKYGVETIPLLQLEGPKPNKHNMFALRKREGKVSVSHGDAGLMLLGLQLTPPTKKDAQTNVTAALPEWPGADAVYSYLYKVLEKMGAENWKMAVAIAKKRRTKPVPLEATDDMRDIIDALGKGDEEQLKALQMKYKTSRYV